MKLPSKITSYNESVLSKMVPILQELEKRDMSLLSLYIKVKNLFGNIEEYIDTLDCLFLIGKIEYAKEREVLHYVA